MVRVLTVGQRYFVCSGAGPPGPRTTKDKKVQRHGNFIEIMVTSRQTGGGGGSSSVDLKLGNLFRSD